MNYSEASYFDGYHFHHIAAKFEHDRLINTRTACRQVAERRHTERRTGSRVLSCA